VGHGIHEPPSIRQHEGPEPTPSGVVAWLVLLLVAAAGGCAGYRPEPISSVPFLARSQVKSEHGIRVTVAVPSDEESEQLFGVPLATEGIQPVWLRIENRGEEPYWFAPAALDPSYFTPLEAANRCRSAFASSSTNEEMRRHFLELAIGSYVAPGHRIEGVVFTNLDRGVKPVNVELIGRGRLVALFFLVQLPGFRADYQHATPVETRYAPNEIRAVDEAGLRRALEAMPCCASTADGKGVEDPLNFVLVGSTGEVFPSFAQTGWHVSEVLERRSALRTFWSYFFGRRYRYAPISSVYLFERRQDLSLQKTRETARERNHLRIWLSPLRFAGKPVWVGQISRDIGLAFRWKGLVVHEVDPDVDEARNYLIQDMLRAQRLAKFGWVKGVGATSVTNPRHMADGTPFFTDGLRAVLVFDQKPRSLEEIEILDWERVPPR
jgi:hypothetical protein